MSNFYVYCFLFYFSIVLSENAKNNITLCENGCTAIVDSSSNRITGPADEIEKIHTKIGAKAFFFNRYRVSHIISQLKAMYIFRVEISSHFQIHLFLK